MRRISQILAQYVTDSGVSGTNIYDTVAELPLSGNSTGAQAFVTATNRLYIWNGSGWFEIALINTNPSITAGGNATYELASDGTPTVITLTANDPEGIPIAWSYSVTSGSLGGTTVSNVDNVFTITPSTNEADAGEFSITFTASDGVNFDTSTSSFTLSFGIDWTNAAITYTLNNPNAYGTAAGDNFGMAVAVLGNYAAISARFEDDAGGTDSGKVYIYNVSTGTLIHTLNNPNAYSSSASDQFGISVAITETYVVVGAYGEDVAGVGSDTGIAYVFDL